VLLAATLAGCAPSAPTVTPGTLVAHASLTPVATARSAAPSPKTVATSASGSAALPSSAGTYLAPVSVRKAAVQLLQTADDHMQQELTDGKNDFGSSAFATWFDSEQQDNNYEDVFVKVNAMFNGSDEPQSVSAWRDDATQAQDDIGSWATDALNAAGSGGTLPDDSTVLADLAAVEKDVTAVGTGQ
jgi:hypothetical protein